MTTPQTIHDVPVLMCSAEGEPFTCERDVLDLVGNASYRSIAWVVVPAARFGEDFFRLRTRVAGDIVQKFVTYRVGLVVLGDISEWTAASESLRDFVRECNRGRQTWFLTDLEELHERLSS
jgi:hypothetical protein